MFAVERLGSYITRGVYTVSGPFHPFGGAVDIIVVEQPDGSFKSSPWYVRFGKFQGVLKVREKVVNVSVNGVDADFHMFLDQRGEAYFLREMAEGEEGEFVLYPSSSGDETDEQSQKNQGPPLHSKSCNYDSNKFDFGDEVVDASKGKILARTNSRRSRLFGLVFGRRSLKEDSFREGDGGCMVRISSLDRAEIAANLLEVKWSTNLDTITNSRKDNAVQFSASFSSDDNLDRDMPVSDEQSQAGSSVHNTIETSVDHLISAEETGSCSAEMVNDSQDGLDKVECFVEETSIGTAEQVAETLMFGDSVMEEKWKFVADISQNMDKSSSSSADDNVNAEVISEVTSVGSQIADALKVCDEYTLDREQAADDRGFPLPSFSMHEENAVDKVQSLVYCETSESSIAGLDGPSERTQETLYVASGESSIVPFHGEALHETVQLPKEDTINQQDDEMELETEHIKACNCKSQQTNPCPCTQGNDKVNLDVPLTVSTPYTQMVNITPTFGSVEEVNSKRICPISAFGNLADQIQDEESNMVPIARNGLQSSTEFVGNAEHIHGDCGSIRTASTLSESSEDEQFLFSDLDGTKLTEIICESKFSNDADEEKHCLFSLEGIEEANGSSSTKDGACSSPDEILHENLPDGLENLTEDLNGTSTSIDIPSSHCTVGEDIGRLAESLPSMRSSTSNQDADDLYHPLSHSLDSSSKSLDWTSLGKNESSFVNVEQDNQNQSAQGDPNNGNTSNSKDIRNGDASTAIGDLSQAIVAPGGSWGIWPFSMKRSRSRSAIQPILNDTRGSDVDHSSDKTNGVDGDKNVLKSRLMKKMVRARTPTSEQLASLDLKEGRNVVTFTFSTAMLGNQKVDARIYKWKWNTRIVISDVDGTITRSDVLGQFMPLVGVDWSQTGVAHLFSAIKENGYQMLFLSARAISQAYHTRQFLLNLKQDGKALPEGPVVISPDGLFPSLFREVIRRAPHEFKIACLEDIKALFPSDCNPFYAGFGNRDTDEISYLKVGIPRGKIFTINPKGEVVVNRCLDRKSYTSLHALVHGMFPPMASLEREDFNSWNYWKLPPPLIEI